MQWRLICTASINAYNRTRHLRPQCGARRKRDGERCTQIAMANGKCYLHGGRTPRGADWHRTQWPERDAANPEKKLRRKLRDQERAAKKRARRLAAMTPDDLARHKLWHAARAPGSKAKRAAERAIRDQATAARNIFAKPKPRLRPNVEADVLAARRAELNKQRQRLETEIAVQLKIGVFG